MGFTTRDDALIAINLDNRDFWSEAKTASEGQGRFQFFWGYALARVPFVIDNQVWYLTTKYGAFFLTVCALYYAIYKLFRSSWIALAVLVFFLSFIQNGWDHNLLTSFPFVFNSYVVLFLASLGLFATAIDQKKLTLAVLSGVLYFFALGTELFVLFFPCFVAVLLFRGASDESIIRRLILRKQYILAVMLPLLVYLAIYFLWRRIHPSSYDGNNLDGFNPLAAAKVVLTYSLNALPLESLQFVASSGQQFQFASSSNLPTLLAQLNVLHFIKPAVTGLLFARLMTSTRFTAHNTGTLLIGAALALLGVFLPNLLLSFSQKYQNWVASGSKSYTYTYYSFISATVSAGLILSFVNAKSRLWHPKIRIVIITIGIMISMVLSFVIESRNQYIAFDQKLSHRRWQLVDETIKSPNFMKIPDGSTIIAPTLFQHFRGTATVSGDYWDRYIKYKTGKNLQVVKQKCTGMTPCYSLVFRQASHSDDQFIILKRLKEATSLVFTEVSVFSIPNYAGATLSGSFIPAEGSPKLEIDGTPIVNVGAGIFSVKIPLVVGTGFARMATLSGNVEFIPEGVTISPFDIEPRLRSLSAELADGIDFGEREYPDFLAEVTGMSGHESWGRWTDAATGPVAKFRFKQPLPKKFTLEIVARAFGPNYGVPVKVQVGRVEKTFLLNPKNMTPYPMVFETDGAADTLEITPPKPTSPNDIDPRDGDKRKLGIGLTSLKIKI